MAFSVVYTSLLLVQSKIAHKTSVAGNQVLTVRTEAGSRFIAPPIAGPYTARHLPSDQPAL